MNSTGIMMDISRAIADFQHLELFLAVAIVGWISASWVMRKREKNS